MAYDNEKCLYVQLVSEDSIIFEFEQRREDRDVRLDKLPLHTKLKINLNYLNCLQINIDLRCTNK